MKAILVSLLLCTAGLASAQTIKIDTLSVKDSLTVMRIRLSAKDMKLSKQIKQDSITLRILYNSLGDVQKEYNRNEPAPDEILFCYGIIKQKKELNAQMIYKFGTLLLPIYKKKDFDQMLEIVKVLEHKVFGIEDFGGMMAYYTMEAYLDFSE